jgi:hypothetical protein
MFGLLATKRRGDAREARMVELASYALMGLTAMLVIAFCFACGIEPPSTQEKLLCDLINNAHGSFFDDRDPNKKSSIPDLC